MPSLVFHTPLARRIIEHIFLKPFAGHRQEEVVAVGIEMRRVVWPLEVAFAELVIAQTYHAIFGIVHHDRYAALAAHLADGFAHLREAWAVDIPRRDVAYLSLWANGAYLIEHHLERVDKHAERIGVVFHLVSIIMPCYDEHIVG